MKICNFGSLNLDIVYSVDHSVTPGETLASSERNEFCGGKGLNQSVALSLAGAEVYHAGCVGSGGDKLIAFLGEKNVDTRFVSRVPSPCGHAIIQVDKNGQNSILLYGGANRLITQKAASSVLEHFGKGDILVLQNEINEIPFIMKTAKERGMRVVFNPSPFEDAIAETYPLECVSWFVVNEIEGEMMTGFSDKDRIIKSLSEKYSPEGILLTLGEKGSVCFSNGRYFEQSAFSVPVRDTTGAGDTFLGYFFALLDSFGISEALRYASAASALAVSKNGAATSVPALSDVEAFLKTPRG